MAALAKELLNLPSPPQTTTRNVMAGRKKTKCLVFFTSDKTVGIVNLSAIAYSQSGIKPEDVEEGVMYDKIRFQGKPYQGKVLKISDDVNALKKEQDIVAFSLDEASTENESGKTISTEPEPELEDELGPLPDPAKSKRCKLSEKRMQVLAKAAAQREMFRNEQISSCSDDAGDCDESEKHDHTNELPIAPVREESTQHDPHLERQSAVSPLPALLASSVSTQPEVSPVTELPNSNVCTQPPVNPPIKLPASSASAEPPVSPLSTSNVSHNSNGHSGVPYVPGQHASAFSQVTRAQSYWNPSYQLMPFGRQISQAMTLSDNFIEPHEYVSLQQENARLLEENMRLKAELDEMNQSRECAICLNKMKASVQEVRFLRRLADVLSDGNTSSGTECSHEMERDLHIDSAPTAPVVVTSKTTKTVPQKRRIQEEKSAKPLKLPKIQNLAEGDAQSDQVDVELFPGTGVMVHPQKLKYALAMCKGKSSKKMVRRLLEAMFSEEELIRGCAVGCSRGKKKSSSTVPLNKAKVEAIKAYVRDHYKDEDLPDAHLHRTINCACADLRGKYKSTE